MIYLTGVKIRHSFQCTKFRVYLFDTSITLVKALNNTPTDIPLLAHALKMIHYYFITPILSGLAVLLGGKMWWVSCGGEKVGEVWWKSEGNSGGGSCA